jgi:hypothetical protein
MWGYLTRAGRPCRVLACLRKDETFAQLKSRHILRKLRCCPRRAGQLAKAVHALEIQAA